MYLLASLRCDDNERALISSMTIAMGTLVIVYCGVSGYIVNLHQVIKPGLPGNEAVTLMKFSST